MVRFSVGGDEDGNEERPANTPLPKRPRVSDPIKYKCTVTAATTSAVPAVTTSATPTVSNFRVLPAATAAPQPQAERIVPAANPIAAVLDSADESSDPSWSNSQSEYSSSEVSLEEEEYVTQQETLLSGQRGPGFLPGETQTISVASKTAEASNRSVIAILTDPDVLDCPICFDPLCLPVYQCENGHIACASCCTLMKHKCASCCWPIGYNRCRAIEKVLESVRSPCKNIKLGCRESFSYSKKLDHEKKCTYAQCSCPHVGCDFVCTYKFVYTHFTLKHSQSSKQFRFNCTISLSIDKNQQHAFLQEMTRGTIFILNRSIETVGSFVDVVCVASPPEKGAYLYELRATVGENSMILKSVVDVMPKWLGLPPKKVYLIVPGDFISTSEQLKLELRIWKNPLHHSLCL